MGSLPATFHTSAQLLFFSAFSNDFTRARARARLPVGAPAHWRAGPAPPRRAGGTAAGAGAGTALAEPTQERATTRPSGRQGLGI